MPLPYRYKPFHKNYSLPLSHQLQSFLFTYLEWRQLIKQKANQRQSLYDIITVGYFLCLKNDFFFLDFKLSPCSECCLFSFG